jgi:cytochrome P450
LDAARPDDAVVRLRLGFRRLYLLNHPEPIRHVLQARHAQYWKGPHVARLKPLFGEGLTTSEGAHWRRQRRLLQPLFQPHRLAPLAAVIAQATEAMLQRWQLLMERGQPIDIVAATHALAQEISSGLLFGDRLGGERQAFHQAMTAAFEQLARRTWAALVWPSCFPTPGNRRLRRALHTLDAAVYRLIEEGRQTGDAGDDLLGMLLRLRDDATGQPLSTAQLRDEVLTLFAAGSTTTAAALAWTCYLVAQHPDVERRLQTELRRVLHGRHPTPQDLPALTYTRMVIEESLRLYPPTWITARTPLADDDLGGCRIPADAILLLSPYVLHRHPSFWDHPERFEPQRFRPDLAAQRPPFAYFPFGGGPRRCIGQSLAMMALTLILARVFQTFRLRPLPGRRVEPYPRITLQPPPGMLLQLQPCDRA